MNVLSSIDTADLPVTELDATSSGTRTPSSISCTSRRSTTATTTASATSSASTEKLDYLQDLGVTALWLLPFYPSPRPRRRLRHLRLRRHQPGFRHDDGFPPLHAGGAQARGFRVITELVINHTSDQHPWFKRATRSPKGSSARNWYVWSDTDQKYAGTRIIFTDTEKSNWTWDPEAQAYYWHRFFSHQPDLNFDNPRVVQRGDAGDEALARHRRRRLPPRRHALSLRARGHQQREPAGDACRHPQACAPSSTHYSQGKVLLAEANQWPEDVQAYFGNGDECHMAYHFPLMPRIYMAIAQEDRFPITDIMRQTPEIPDELPVGACSCAITTS